MKLLLKQLTDGELKKLAVIVDADYLSVNPPNDGYRYTIKKIEEIASPFGFCLNQNNGNGLIFKHDDELSDFGLWVMPTNKEDGMLEDFIKYCINSRTTAF